MGRSCFAAACAALAILTAAAPACAVERKALVRGVRDRGLAAEIQRAVGDERTGPTTRLEARRRAREASDSAQALLRSEGYYDAQITPDVTEGDKPKSGPRAVIDIDVGPRSHLGASAITWVGEAPDAAAQARAKAALDLKPGTPGRAVDVIAAEGRAIAALTEAGYADAVSQPRQVVVDHATHELTPTYLIASGAKVRLDGLQISTRGRTDPAWVKHLKPWRDGDIYRPDKVGELERRLTDTQVYDSVAVALAPAANSDGLRPVIVSLADRARRSLDFSAGYSTSEGGDFDVKWLHYNELRRGDTLTLEARLAQIDSRYGGELQLPDFLAPGQTLTPSAYYFRTVTDAFTETGEILSLDLTQRYGKTSFLTRGVSITNSRVDDKELGSINLTALRLIGAFFIDRSDNTLDPHRGWKADARLVPTFTTGDEQLVYLRAVAQASGYLAFDRAGDTVLAVRGRVGSLIGAGIPSVPAEDRFFAGGGGSVRGYDFQGVGPHYADNTPRGGLSLVEATVELRQRIGLTPFSAVVFADAGSVGDSAYPELKTVQTSVGIGARYNLGFAPIRVDIAVPVGSPGYGQPPFQIYLSIGQSF